MQTKPLLLLGLLGLFANGAWASSDDFARLQLTHRAFTMPEGAPSNIYALAQTADGTLWIGGGTGLTRFDGVRFVQYPGAAEETLPSTNISTLAAAPDGGLWIGFRLGGVGFLKSGHLTGYGEAEGFPSGTVTQFSFDRHGSLWAAARNGLAHFKDGRWEKIGIEPAGEPLQAVLADRSGTLWIAARNGLFARIDGNAHFREVSGATFKIHSAGHTLAEAPDGTVWAAADDAFVRVDRRHGPPPGSVTTVHGLARGPMIVDRDGNLWMSHAELARLADPPRDAVADVTVRPEQLTELQELTGTYVSDILEDREGNLWAGTNNGLDRFTRTNIVRSAPECSAGAFAAGENGTVWAACQYHQMSKVYEIRDGKIASSQEVDPYLSVAYRDREGTIWFAGPSAIGRLEGGKVVLSPLPESMRGADVQALVRDRNGAMWVSVVRKGIFRLLDGEWSEYGNVDALPRGPAIVATEDDDGAIWFGYPNDRIARMRGDAVQVFDSALGLKVGNVQSIYANGDNVWVGGELGFARFDGARFMPVRAASGSPFKGISGIVSARNGDLWVNGIDGIVHIVKNEVDRIVRDRAHPVECEVFNYLDGVPGTAVQLRPLPTAIQTSDGHLSFSMTGAVVSIDATHLVRNSLPPPVTIWSLASGPERHSDFTKDLQLPAHTESLQIDYSAGSLTIPERVRFRYKLDGLDNGWQDAGTRREALYTNLGPGHYTFHVTAANNDGVWNDTGSSLEFTIPPAFYQTLWFYALCALACLGLLAALYRVRVRQVAAQVRGRLEERLAERERIARELHDTLLQGMQGLIWRFQAAADRIPPNEPARQMLEQSLDRADKLLGESRDKVKDLRPAAATVTDLADAIAAEGEQFAELHPAEFRVSAHGTRRALHPIVREEGFVIAREALGNAFQHARATRIEAEVTYDDAALHVRVRDDGQGIDTAVLSAGGKAGHFGLIGMRERAKKLGAHLEVWSKPGNGTEVDLRVPAQVAYRDS